MGMQMCDMMGSVPHASAGALEPVQIPLSKPLGINFEEQEGTLGVYVESVQPGGSAHMSGMVHIGDVVLAVGQLDVSQFNLDRVLQLIQACPGQLILTLGRANNMGAVGNPTHSSPQQAVSPFPHLLRQGTERGGMMMEQGGFQAGDEVEVYSKSSNAWSPGRVDEAVGENVRVSYENADGVGLTKTVSISSKEIRHTNAVARLQTFPLATGFPVN